MVENTKGLPSYVAGSIPISSLYDFHQNDGLSLYLCVSKDWTRMFIVDADAAWDYALSDPKLKKEIKNIEAQRITNPNGIVKCTAYVTVNHLPQSAWVEVF